MISQGDLIYLLTKILNLLKGRAKKLCPKYIEPYKVAKAELANSMYTLELPMAYRNVELFQSFMYPY